MLLRTIGHMIGLDAGWFVYDLIWVFIVMAFMCYAFHVISNKNHRGIWGFIMMMFVLYAVLDVASLMGITHFTDEHMLAFTLFQMGFIVLATRTRFEKYAFPVFILVFFFMSWAITP